MRRLTNKLGRHRLAHRSKGLAVTEVKAVAGGGSTLKIEARGKKPVVMKVTESGVPGAEDMRIDMAPPRVASVEDPALQARIERSAARLRVTLDDQLGRTTPESVRKLANGRA